MSVQLLGQPRCEVVQTGKHFFVVHPLRPDDADGAHRLAVHRHRPQHEARVGQRGIRVVAADEDVRLLGVGVGQQRGEFFPFADQLQNALRLRDVVNSG